MAKSANYGEDVIELGDHLVVDETAKKDLTEDGENIQLTDLAGPQSLPEPERPDIEEEFHPLHYIEKPEDKSGASERSLETQHNGLTSSVTSTHEFDENNEDQRRSIASSVINNAVSGYENERRCQIPTDSVQGGPLSITPLDVTSKSEDDILAEFGDSKEGAVHKICKIFWTYLNITVALYIPGRAEPFICSGVLTDPQTWKKFLNDMNLSNKEHSCKPARSTLLLKIYDDFFKNTNQIPTVSRMTVELTFRSPEGPVTVTVTGCVEEYYVKPNAVYLLSPPIPTAVCEQLHTVYVKLRNVVRGMSKESMSMRSLFIVSLRDTGEKDLFPINLIPEELRLEETAMVYLMHVYEEKKEREEGSSDQILRVNQGKQHAFIIQAGFVLSQF